MKLCANCRQMIAEDLEYCPACGMKLGDGLTHVDDYEILDVTHEGYSSILCRARKKGEDRHVMLRLFKPDTVMTDEVAYRLKLELGELQKLPKEDFVQHHILTQSSDGMWYRVSEWVDAESWGDMISRGVFNNYPVAFDIFQQIASILEVLHQSGHSIPHLILSDILVFKKSEGGYGVKIDYKLSRFLDPLLMRPEPMLKRLLNCHPDLANFDQPLDYQSDIWSLGKIFVELCSGELEACDLHSQVNDLPLPYNAKLLFKTMLSSDPSLRPNSMGEVARALGRIRAREAAGDRKRRLKRMLVPTKAVSRLQTRMRLMTALVLAMIIVGAAVWFWQGAQPEGTSRRLEEFAAKYSPSVAYVLVHYGIKVEKQTVYQSVAQGTSFLVDMQGYLLSSRHVVCPWLEDARLLQTMAVLKHGGRSPHFFYRVYLWFEGRKAFNLSGGDSKDIADNFYVQNAYVSDGSPSVELVGVALPPTQKRQIAASPLRDDFAVLKISKVPQGLAPLPLDREMHSTQLPKLADVIALGFPLGRSTQEITVNVSATKGSIRRTFDNSFQVDAAFYGGNSGGPVIGGNGKVWGIATGVATSRSTGPLPSMTNVTPLWNLGMVLPINKSLDFLEQIKAGQHKWNGVVDFEAGERLKRIIKPARQGRWAVALEQAEKELTKSKDPNLILAAGVMNLCSGRLDRAREHFVHSVSINPGESRSELLAFVIDWLQDRPSPFKERLLKYDWRSPKEFYGYLSRFLTGQVKEQEGLKGWENLNEKGWILYLAGLMKAQKGDMDQAESWLAEAALAADPDDWAHYLALARLQDIQQKRLTGLKDKSGWDSYQAQVKEFEDRLKKTIKAKKESKAKLEQMARVMMQSGSDLESQAGLRMQMLKLAPDNYDQLAPLAFIFAAAQKWDDALIQAELFLKRPGRESQERLALGILVPQILHFTGKKEAALKHLKAYLQSTREPWYRAVADCLAGNRTKGSLTGEMADLPQDLLITNVALGMWSEGEGDARAALDYYRTALESLLDNWYEYDLARARLKDLKSE
jgi:hypothetical protein